MELTELRKINQGMTGSQAAKVIYDNDRKLFDEINECQQDLDENAVIVGRANAQAGRYSGETITLVQSTGNSETAVMSQAAITNEYDRMNNSLSGVCFISDDKGGVSELAKVKVNAKTASMAAMDLKGRSISAIIDEFVNYKVSANKTITELNARITTLENTIKGL